MAGSKNFGINNNDNLTKRETECLHYVDLGLENKEIGEILCISSHTVKAHLISCNRKLRTKKRGQAAHKARELGIIPLPNLKQP